MIKKEGQKNKKKKKSHLSKICRIRMRSQTFRRKKLESGKGHPKPQFFLSLVFFCFYFCIPSQALGASKYIFFLFSFAL